MLLTAALLSMGVIMVSSAGLTVDSEQPLSLAGLLLGRTAILAALALAMMVLGTRLSVDRLYRAMSAGLAPWIMGAVVILLLAVHLPVVGLEINGARRWLNLGVVTFQPSEIAKWSIVVLVAWYAARHVAVIGQLKRGFLWPMLAVGLLCALIATEDLGTAMLIGAVGVALLIAAGARLRHAALLAGPAAAGLVGAVLMSPYRLDRLRAFLDPWQDPQGIGYHVIQSMITVAGGGVAGRGLGNSIQKFGYLPEDTSDFIFAVISEELGLIGVLTVVCLYGALLLCGLSIARRVEDPFGRLLALGILLTIGLQALINMMVVTALAPTKGIALPLISAGGTGWVLTALAVGVVAGLERGQIYFPRPQNRSVPT